MTMRLAKIMNVPLKATFDWRDKEDAAYRGQRGVIEWAPAAKIHTPKLAHPEDATDFVMEVRENGNGGV